MGSVSAAQLNSAINQILELSKAHPNGLTDKMMEENLRDVSLEVRVQAINRLSKAGQLEFYKQGSFNVYKILRKELSDKLSGLSQEDRIVYQAIQRAGNNGIWTVLIKRETNLAEPQSRKALKNLETRAMIKQIKNSQGKKVFMLAELSPSDDLTGGVFYTNNKLDPELINIVKDVCLRIVAQKKLATLESIADLVKSSGILKEQIKIDAVKQVMDMLIIDHEVEEVTSTGKGEFSSIPMNTQCYRVSQIRAQETSAFTNVPCGICPVLHECTEDGLISPKTCIYFNKWLSF